MIKRLVWLLVLALGSGATLAFLMISEQPNVTSQTALSPAKANAAKQLASQLGYQVLRSNQSTQIKLDQEQIGLLAQSASHFLPHTDIVANLSASGVMFASATELTFTNKPLFINSRCLLMPDGIRLGFEDCYIGRVPIPQFIVRGVISLLINQFSQPPLQTELARVLNEAYIDNNLLVVGEFDAQQLRAQIKDNISDLSGLIGTNLGQVDLNPELLAVYLEHLNQIKQPHVSSLSFYLSEVMILAQKRSAIADPIEENRAAIWALSMSVGGSKLARLVGFPKEAGDIPRLRVKLRERDDLPLHFSYSMVLQQLGEKDVAHRIGQFKELLDTNRGGTGYSFADMAANKAGMNLAEMATRSVDSALAVQSMLQITPPEGLYMPSIEGLSEGFNEQRFDDEFGSIKSDSYQKMETEIDNRIAELAINQATIQ